MYAGGSVEAVVELLDDSIVWHVPGTSPIAGDHRGPDAVLRYFLRRRELARGTMRMHERELLIDGDAVIQLVDGTAELDGQPTRWRTVGVYRVRDGRVAEVWLVPLELDHFDRIWTPGNSDQDAPEETV
jgi:ketosteroid isomerase-like protein